MQNLSNESKARIDQAREINGHTIDMREETYSSSQEDLKRLQNDTILKRIPIGAEATTVLVYINNICFSFIISRPENKTGLTGLTGMRFGASKKYILHISTMFSWQIFITSVCANALRQRYVLKKC